MKKEKIITIALFSAIIIVSIIMRVLPHPANFIPIGALALISGVYIKSRWGIMLPVTVMMVSDLIVGMHNIVLFTWGSFLVIGMIGWWIRKNKNIFRLVGGTLAGSIIFYLITNMAVWAFTPLYHKSLFGLMDSYYMAIPFFRNTAMGDLFYVGVFFGVFELVYFLALNKNKVKSKSELVLK